MALFGSRKTCVLVLLVLATVLTLTMIYSENGWLNLRELRLQKEQLHAANEELREKNRRLMLRIERIKKDPKYMEDEARKKLGLIRPDETIYRLAEEPDTTGS